MCFSLQASMAASVLLTVCGIITLKKAQTTATRLLAIAPLFFAVQQALEGIVWMTINKGTTDTLLHHLAVYGFLSFALLFWPVYIPFSLYIIEPQVIRKKFLLIALVSGLLAVSGNLATWITSGMSATVVGHHIAYLPIAPNSYVDMFYNIGLCLYVFAIAGSMFISSIPYMWMCGLLALISFFVAHLLYIYAFGSVWCFFAAIGSVMIYYIIDQYNKNICLHSTLNS